MYVVLSFGKNESKVQDKAERALLCVRIFPTLEARQTDKGRNQNINHSNYLTRSASSHSNEIQDSENLTYSIKNTKSHPLHISKQFSTHSDCLRSISF